MLRTALRLFVAYSHTDLVAARRFRRQVLRLRSSLPGDSVFLDQEVLQPAAEGSEERIAEALATCSLFVLLCGKDTADRRRVNEELHEARARALRGDHITVLPILLRPNAHIPADAANLQAAFYEAIFPAVRWARNGVAALMTTTTIAAIAFGVMWINGFGLQKYLHYRSLAHFSDVSRNANFRAGTLRRDIYSRVWLQRFEHGIVLLPIEEEAFTSHVGDRTFNDSLFVLRKDDAGKGSWFLQRRPPTRGDFYDKRDFEALLRGSEDFEGLLHWPASSGLSQQQVASLFSPHAETSPINICGGIALAYAKYRLDRYIGAPVEHTFDGEMLIREMADGYEMSLLPSTNVRPVAAGMLSRRAQATLVLKRPAAPEITKFGEERVGGGIEVLERGTWREFDGTSQAEALFRPSDSFVRDLHGLDVPTRRLLQ